MAWREARGARTSLLLLVAAVAVGVAALVAIRSFAEAAQRAVRAEARALLGADLAAGSAAPFSAQAEARLARMLAEAGAHRTARVTGFGAMARAADRGATRLVQVLAVEPGYPFYAAIDTQPPGVWERLGDGRSALVDPALLAALEAQVGDALLLGEARLRIAGVVTRFPGDLGLRSALGPRVFIPRRLAQETGLLGPGSRVRHELYVQMADGVPAPLLLRHRAPLAAERVNLRTLDEDRQRLSDGLLRLGRFLGLVGLVALLLGGIGVASGVRVLLRRRREAIAVLRSLGASSRQVLAVYLLQATALGVLGAGLGTLLGLVAAAALPALLAGLLPVGVSASGSWTAVALGLGVGTGTALAAALPALSAVRHVSPLAALRRDVEPGPGARDAWDRAALLLPLAGVAVVVVFQAGSLGFGLALGAGLTLVVLLLVLVASALRGLARRIVARRWPYVLRQGLANLYRPANQTRAVVLSLGLGAFLLGTLLVLERSLLDELRVDGDARRPNLALFDIQPDQRPGVEALLAEAGLDPAPATPVVPMRLLSVKGRPVAEALARLDSAGRPAANAWALRREYRSSYRDSLGPAETLVAGSHWRPGSWRGGDVESELPVSLDEGLAEELGVGVGDALVWDVQGVAIRSRVASLRRVRWARLEPNFFALFPDGPLRQAPQSFVRLLRVEEAAARARLERRVVGAFPNVSALDLADVEAGLRALSDRLAWAIRFMALFSGAVGLLVLLGAVAASQRERLREAVLLKTLGASRRQVRDVVLVEFACLGGLAAAAGAVLALLAGWGLLRFAFESPFVAPLPGLLALGVAVAALCAGLGALASRQVFGHTSLELLRAE
jgi:putative ABC transport system permease protein